LDLQLPMQSVPITTKVVSLNPTHGEVYSIQHYVIKFVSDLRQVGGSPVFSTNKTDCHDITKLLLKVVLNTITLIINISFFSIHEQTSIIFNTVQIKLFQIIPELIQLKNLWQSLFITRATQSVAYPLA
jgi:hypothetical protein